MPMGCGIWRNCSADVRKNNFSDNGSKKQENPLKSQKQQISMGKDCLYLCLSVKGFHEMRLYRQSKGISLGKCLCFFPILC